MSGFSSHRVVCNSKHFAYSVFSDDNCLEDAKLTYTFPWNKCVEYDTNGNYVWVQSAIALKSAVVAAALAAVSLSY